MKRSGPLARKTPLRSRAAKAWVKPERRAPTPLALPSAATMARLDGTPQPAPKRSYVRSPALVKAYRLIPCQFERWHCHTDGVLCLREDTCCCHANTQTWGKGTGIKVDDNRAAAGCSMHHYMLDQGTGWTKDEKRAQFWRAHVRSVYLLVALGHWPESVPVPDVHHCPWA